MSLLRLRPVTGRDAALWHLLAGFTSNGWIIPTTFDIPRSEALFDVAAANGLRYVEADGYGLLDERNV